jgi:hypothetical protein
MAPILAIASMWQGRFIRASFDATVLRQAANTLIRSCSCLGAHYRGFRTKLGAPRPSLRLLPPPTRIAGLEANVQRYEERKRLPGGRVVPFIDDIGPSGLIGPVQLVPVVDITIDITDSAMRFAAGVAMSS